ncbi:chemosensory receptor A [Elysia marginata]|uniref:Chemosensory receptor A n=1 Tax=Elysia marginata TaxID=1093978 RepID=A0AAV4JQE2_9GAST|nr:chemosensory receptor A [Elysia marginata]
MDVSTINKSVELAITAMPKPTPSNFMAEFLLTLTVLSYIWPFIFLFGMVTNGINIFVFLKAGANDNVTILLIALACSDLIFLALISPTMCGFLIGALVRPNPWPFDARLLHFLLFWPASTAYDVSCFYAVSLGVMRCACVAMPLKFKLVFTKSRTIKWTLIMVFVAVALRLPVLTINRISWRKDPTTNISSVYLASWNRSLMVRINDVLNRSVIMYLAYITMIACVFILSFKIYQASKIRQKCVAQISQQPGQASDKAALAQGSLSSRDLQVVKSVILVCSIFIVGQLPYIGLSTIRLINPEVDESRSMAGLGYLINQVSITFYYLNASVNIFIYYTCNSKYRSVFRSQLLVKCT